MASTIKYFKLTQIDQKSGFSSLLYPPIEPSFPDLPNLNVFHNEGYWYYATAGSTAKADPDNNILEIPKDQFYEDLTLLINSKKNDYLRLIDVDFLDISEKIKKEHPELHTITGLERYQEALNYKNENIESATLIEESTVSKKPIEDLVDDIISDYNEFKQKETKLITLKTKLYTRINTFSIDSSVDKLVDSFLSWFSKNEFVGNRTVDPSIFVITESTVSTLSSEDGENYFMSYYYPNLLYRWRDLP
jgi:hypothetical protein